MDTEAAMAKRELEKAEARIEELMEQVESLDAASKARDREVDGLKSMLYKALRDKEASFLQIQKKLADDYEMAMNEQDQIRAKLEDEERTTEDLKRRARELENQLAKSDAKLKAATKDLAKAEKALTAPRVGQEATAGNAEGSAAREMAVRVEELQARLEEMERAKARADAKAAQEHSLRLSQEQAFMKAAGEGREAEEAQRRCRALREEVEEAQQQVEAEQQRRKAAEGDLERAHKGWAKEKEELEVRMKRILAEREEERVSMSSANRVMQLSVDAMRGDLRRSVETSREGDGRLRRTVQELRGRAAARETELERELKEAQGRGDSLEAQLRGAAARAEEAEGQVESLRAKVKTVEAKAEEAAARAERAEEEKSAAQERARESLEALAEAESVAVDQERSRDKLKGKLLDLEGALQRALGEASAAAQRAQEMEQQLAAKEEEVGDLRQRLEEAVGAEARAAAEAVQEQGRAASLSQEATEMRMSLRGMGALSRKSLEAEHLQSVVQSQDRSLQEAAQELGATEQRLLALERERGEAQEARAAAEAECQRLLALLETVQKQLLAAEEEHAAALEDAEGSWRLAQGELERARAAARSWEDEREASDQRCQMLQQLLDDATTRLQEMQRGKEDAQAQVQKLQAAAEGASEVEQLRSALASAETFAEAQQTRSQELEAQLEESGRLLQEAQEQMQQLEGSVRTLEGALGERGALAEQLSEARAALAEKEETVQAMQQQLEELVPGAGQGRVTQEAHEEALQAYQRVQLLLGLCALWKLGEEAETAELREQLSKAQAEAEAAEWAVKLVGRDLEFAKQGLKERSSRVSGLEADVRELQGRLQESGKELKGTQAQLEKTKEKARAFYKALVEQKEVTLRVKDALAQATVGGVASLSAAAGAVARSAAAAEASFAALQEGAEADGVDGAGKGKREAREGEGAQEGRVAKVLRMDERSPLASKDSQVPQAPACDREEEEAGSMRERAEDLQRRVAQLEGAAAQDKDRLAKMYEDMVRARRDGEELSQQLAGRALVLSAVEAERSAALQEAGAARRGLADAHLELGQLREQVQRLGTELAAREEGTPTDAARLQALQEQVQQLQEEKGALEARLGAAQQEIKEVKRELHSLSTLVETKGGYTDVSLRVYHSPEKPSGAAARGEGEREWAAGAVEVSRVESTPPSSSAVRASVSPKGAVAPRVLFGRASSGTKPGSAVRMSESEILRGEFETERALARREVRNLQGELEELKQQLKEREQHIEALRSGLPLGPSAPSPRRAAVDRTARKLSSPMLPTLSAAAAAKEATFNVLRPKPVEHPGSSTGGLRGELSAGQDGGTSTADASGEGSGTDSSGAGASRVRAALEKFKKMERKAPPPLPDAGRVRRRSSLGGPTFGNENAGWTAGRPPAGQGQGQSNDGPALKRLSTGPGLTVPKRDSSPPLPTATSLDSDTGPEVQPLRESNGVRNSSGPKFGAVTRKSAGILEGQAEGPTTQIKGGLLKESI